MLSGIDATKHGSQFPQETVQKISIKLAPCTSLKFPENDQVYLSILENLE
jgi:hypothetical protein